MSWPLTGLMTDAPLAALVATLVVIAIAVWCGVFGRDREREAARWLGLGLLWTALALTVLSPSLATVIPGLPNDHYHAFADPMVFTLIGMGAAVLWRAGRRRAGAVDAAGARRRRARSVTAGRVRRPSSASSASRSRFEPRRPAAGGPSRRRLPGRGRRPRAGSSAAAGRRPI